VEENEMMRIGLVGLGKIAQTKYLPALLDMDHVELTALCEQSSSLAEQTARTFRLPPDIVCGTLSQLIERKPELVFVLTHEHFRICGELLNAGIGVCVEKPLCWSSEQAKSLVERAEQQNIPLFAAYMKKYDPTFQAFQQEIAALGSPLSMDVVCYAGNNKRWCDVQFRISKESREEKAAAKQSLESDWSTFWTETGGLGHREAGQLLLQLGIHQINLLRELLGEIKVQDAVFQKQKGIQTVSTRFLSASGTPVHYTLIPLFSAPWLWTERYEAVYPDRILTYCPGSPFLRTSESTLRQIGASDVLQDQTRRFGVTEPFSAMMRDIIASADGNISDPSARDAVRDLEIIESILEQGFRR